MNDPEEKLFLFFKKFLWKMQAGEIIEQFRENYFAKFTQACTFSKLARKDFVSMLLISHLL